MLRHGYISHCSEYALSIILSIKITAAVAQWVGALASQAEGWVFESQPRQTKVVKTGSDSSIVKRSALGVSVTLKLMSRVTIGVARSLLNDHKCRT